MRFLLHNHCLYSPFTKLSSLSSSFYPMGSIPFCKSSSLLFLSHLSSSSSSYSSSQRYFLYRSNLLLHGTFPVQPMSPLKPLSMKTNGVSHFTSHAPPDGDLSSTQLNVLRKKLEELNIDTKSCFPGQRNHLLCPRCKGGDSGERSLSINISEDGGSAVWTCFRAKCGWKGRTLIAIAFTYYRHGELVSCKYRDVNKKFWQEANTEKIFYGLDGIDGASDIIIVEGEIDKLSMEEAGFHNCVSVPDGAPPRSVSQKDVPPTDKDTKYQYLWNCKEYLSKASRIILATDGDPPGQALAEEIARRVVSGRCWRVKWPKKNEVNHFKDANEDIESSLAVLLSFKFLPEDIVSMAIDCPTILDLEFLKKWEVSLSQIGLRSVSTSMTRSVLVLSRRLNLDSSIFNRTVNFLKRLGLSEAAVIRVLQDYPEIVLSNEREISGTIEFLMGIGIRRDEIDRIIRLIPIVLGFRVDGRLKSLVSEFEELGFDQNVIAREIVREPSILGTELGEISRCLELLRNLKCRNSIKEKIFRDGAFRAAFEVKQRIDCLCKKGLIRTQAFKLLWKEPRLVTYELENIEKKIDFLIHKMKFGVECLIDVPEYLGINFEKQIVPRHNVIEYLRSKSWLGSQVGLREIMKPSRLKFYNLFVKPYPECGKMFGKFARDNEMKSPSRHPIGLWKVFKPQRHPESREDSENMKSFMKSLVK